jgi:23S rRNA (adenine2030-N6)-methyltransferase
MNYRHAFHAGAFTDVVKHITLVRLIDYLKRKPAAFRVIDTHAGIGRYDLTGDEASRSPEWRDGIARLIERGLPEPAAALARPYLDIVARQNPDGELVAYPGSPLIAQAMLRSDDRLTAVELHPVDADLLAEALGPDRLVRVVREDGWRALNAALPPPERRGLVLIDPPFEEPGEFDRIVAALVMAQRKFPIGCYALWYPLKDEAGVTAFVAALKDTGIRKILRSEVMVRRPANPPRLFGTGMIVVNPPFVLEQELEVLLPALAPVLADDGRGDFRLEWVAAE